MLDAQAGAETFGSALLAALSSVNSVSGPGMLDFVLVFSLPKLIFDNEVCGQALQLVREIQLLEDLPTIGLARQLLAEQHLITAEHTLKYWPQELYLPSAVYDRSNREKWQSAPHQTLLGRATAMVEECLATYQGIATDPAIDAEMRRLIMAGFVSQTELPALPPLPPRRLPKEEGEARRRRRK
ncbi:MAG: trimethylamine methyltransferase family protein [Chloroflexi bacterium]|nr:trimethylamine methyltransferase family protein [Chloroflexota bacterium]